MANNGITKLYKSILLYLIASIIVTVGAYAGLLPSLVTHDAAGAFTGLAVFLGVFVAGLVIAIIALLMMRSGFKMLASSNKSYGIGVIGTMLEIIGMVIIAIAVIILIVSGASAAASASTSYVGAAIGALVSIAVIVIGVVIALVGVILTMIGLFRIGSANNSALIQVGAVLYLFITIVGVILLIVGLRELSRKTAVK